MSTNELLAVIESLEKERGIERESLIQMVEAALISASRKSVGPVKDLRIEMDRKTLAIRAFAKVVVVETARSRQTEISLSEARRISPSAVLGDELEVEITARGFGRIAAQAAKQAIIQRIRQAEKDIVLKEYKDKVGDVVSGSIVRLDRNDVIVDLGRVEAIMPASERVRTEDYVTGDRIRAYIVSVQEHSSGRHIVLSRSHPNFVKRLFELEISEIADGTVEIKGIAREPGFRAKIAVLSHDEKVDPVGACVGMKGMRVKNIVRELLGEKIDVVRWNEDVKTFVQNSLAPAKLSKVIVDEENKKVTVVVDADQLSLAIGKRGQNARLTSKLLGWKVDIQKDKEDETFEEKVARAVGGLAEMEGVSKELAEKLVHAGFLTVEDLASASIEDLVKLEGIELDQAKMILDAALKRADELDKQQQQGQ
ncbi:MAG: transcription termination/antitermination protein NusA [Lentisphaerae bacterium]|mgnify:CR=1 FL=1|nr:transcription termination/antitermination protein NusA [Lentisphaerota bacterium]